jgi:hypothetical protein
MSSQFYPEWRATVADGTQRKPPPQIHTVLICAALGLQKSRFWGTLVDVLAVTHSFSSRHAVWVRTTALHHERPFAYHASGEDCS